MRKFDLKYLWTAGAAALLTAAAISIPAWAAGGGDSSAQVPSGPPSRAQLDKFASCLKDHGVDVPAPGSTSRPPQPPSSSEMQKITRDCGAPPAPPPGLPPLSGKPAHEVQRAMKKGDCPPPPALPAPTGSSGSAR
jgi:hypothetical protein